VACRAFGKAARVDEDQRRAVLAHQLGEPVVTCCHTSPDITARVGRRKLDREVARADVTRIHDRAGRHAGRIGSVADQEACDFLDRLLRGDSPIRVVRAR